jgi:hypothetical protein
MRTVQSCTGRTLAHDRAFGQRGVPERTARPPLGIPLAVVRMDGMADEETEGAEGDAEQQQPPMVKLTGEAGFTPNFPVVGTEIEYYWTETNFGGKHPDVYHARVVFQKDDQVIDDISVECAALATNESAYRTTKLSAPRERGIGYSITCWVDIDNNPYETNENRAYHTLDVSEP